MNRNQHTLNLTLWKNNIRDKRRIQSNEISVTEAGLIAIPKELAEHIINPNEHVKLFYDQLSKNIGIKTAIDNTNDSYKTIINGYGKGAKTMYLTARTLLTYLDVKPKKYKAYWNKEMEMVIFKYLTTSTTTGNKEKQQ
jgi:hypothetical protein